MKKFLLIFGIGFLALSFNGFSQINVNSSGKVGINNSNPTYRIDVSGNLRVVNSTCELIYDDGRFYVTEDVDLGLTNYRWYSLYVVDPTFTLAATIDSDESIKTDIRDFPSISEKINQLRAVKYRLKDQVNGKGEIIPLTDKGDQFGFIAQEMREIFPDLVTTHEDGKLGIRYTELIPVLVKAFQEQQAEIDGLKARLEKLEAATKQ